MAKGTPITTMQRDMFSQNRAAPADDAGGGPSVSFAELAGSVADALAAAGSGRDTRVVALRFGLSDGRKRTLRAVGDELGITRERVRQLQSAAVDRLRRRARTRPMRLLDCVDALKEWGETVGASLDDAGFVRAFSSMTGAGEPVISAHIRLLREMRIIPNDKRAPPTDVDARVVQIFAGSAAPVSLDTLRAEVRADRNARRAVRAWPKMDLPLRLKLTLGVEIDAEGACAPTDKTFATLKRRDRRLFALVRVLDESKKPLHFTEIAARAKPLLIGRFAMSERNVHAWLDRYKDRFNWAGPGIYGLTEWDVGARTDELDAALGPARRKGIGDEIALLLSERGEPLSMREIERQVLEVRGFAVNRASVSASVAQDKAARFVVLADGRVALSRWRTEGRADSPPPEDEKRIAAD